MRRGGLWGEGEGRRPGGGGGGGGGCLGRRPGIPWAGCARKPMDLTAAALDGSAAALKAIQAVEKSSAGAAVHPRVGDLSYPSFFLQQCTMCGRGSQECPFRAIELGPRKKPPLVGA